MFTCLLSQSGRASRISHRARLSKAFSGLGIGADRPSTYFFSMSHCSLGLDAHTCSAFVWLLERSSQTRQDFLLHRGRWNSEVLLDNLKLRK
eukprot:4822368-Amphidinium_carterae.1